MEVSQMKKGLLLVIGLVFSAVVLFSQGKPVIVVHAFSTASGVSWPYDVKQLQAQTVAELKVMLGKDFDIVAEDPASPPAKVYTLDTEVTGWHAGNAATRIIVGLGAGRESADIEYRLTDGSGKKILERKDTIKTNFYSQGAGSTGTLGHPFAQKIGERIKDAKLK